MAEEKKQEIKNNEIKKARQIVLDAIGEGEKAEEEKVNIKVVPGGFGDKEAAKIESDWGDKKEEVREVPKKEFVKAPEEPAQKKEEEKPKEDLASKELIKAEIEAKKEAIESEIKDIAEKPAEIKAEITPKPVEQPKPALKKAKAAKSFSPAPKKKPKPKKISLEIPVELDLRKKPRKTIRPHFDIKSFFNEKRKIRIIYIITYTFISGIVFYLFFVMAIYNFNPDNYLARKISSFLPVPAIISSEGIIGYYDYKDYSKMLDYDYDKAKTLLITRLIYLRILKENPSASPDEINMAIEKEMKNATLWSLVD